MINLFFRRYLAEKKVIHQCWNELNLAKKEIPNGTYFLQISTKNERSIVKVVVEK